MTPSVDIFFVDLQDVSLRWLRKAERMPPSQVATAKMAMERLLASLDAVPAPLISEYDA